MYDLIKRSFVRRVREELVDALRNTIVVILPLLLLFDNHRPAGIGITVGALLMSLTDLPGNRRAKAMTALQAVVVIGPTALLFSASLPSPLLTGIVLVVLTFLLSTLSALGSRTAAVGAMGIALMVFTLGLRPADPLLFTAYILIGGGWFYLITLIQVYLWPYRSLHQALREALGTTGAFLEAKATCYHASIPLETCYRHIISLNMKVAEKQELVRSLLLSDRANDRASLLLSRVIAVISLYEQATAMHFDYAEVRQRFSSSDVLPVTKEIVSLVAAETKWLAAVFPSSRSYHDPNAAQRLADLLTQLAVIATKLPKAEAAVIRGIIKNTNAISKLLSQIADARPATQVIRNLHLSAYGAFLSESENNWSRWMLIWDIRSPVLRFALRLAVLFTAGYLATLFVAKDDYSYWLLLTILIVARPRLAVTWERNLERLAGTIAGALLASLCVLLIKPALPLLIIASTALIGFFTWNRHRYGLSVICITLCVLISLSLAHGHAETLVTARIWYTLLGCTIAFTGIFIFPIWAGNQLEAMALASMEGNTHFLDTVLQTDGLQEGWLARKEAHLRLARFSEGLRHARLEPGKMDLPRLEQIQVLNYRINALITSLFLTPARKPLLAETSQTMPEEGDLLKGRDLLDRLTAELNALLYP